VETRLFTIGLGGRSAQGFFGILEAAGVRRLIDVRLRNTSQLSGFAKRDDLRFFLRELLGLDYFHLPELAPSQELLTAYRHKQITWQEYEPRFARLLESRRPESSLDCSLFDEAVLLCVEPGPERCHRRLVAEHLARHWSGITIVHL
jgi:uncharacterized protein (DUF488 family)